MLGVLLSPAEQSATDSNAPPLSYAPCTYLRSPLTSCLTPCRGSVPRRQRRGSASARQRRRRAAAAAGGSAQRSRSCHRHSSEALEVFCVYACYFVCKANAALEVPWRPVLSPLRYRRDGAQRPNWRPIAHSARSLAPAASSCLYTGQLSAAGLSTSRWERAASQRCKTGTAEVC